MRAERRLPFNDSPLLFPRSTGAAYQLDDQIYLFPHVVCSTQSSPHRTASFSPRLHWSLLFSRRYAISNSERLRIAADQLLDYVKSGLLVCQLRFLIDTDPVMICHKQSSLLGGLFKKHNVLPSDSQKGSQTAAYYESFEQVLQWPSILMTNDKDIERVRRRLKSNMDKAKMKLQCLTKK